jgi:hypothetical protein
MVWSGGNYTKGNNATGGWVGDASLGIGIEAGRHDTQDDDFATGINQCLNKDGSNAATGNLNDGGFRHTNLGAATARTDAPQVAQVQDGDFIWLGTTSGTATAQTASATPAITAYKAGQKFRMKVGTSLGSTGSTATAHTININGVGAKNIVNNEDSTNPTIGTWIAGAIMELVYDGTNFLITNDPGGWLSFSPAFGVSAGGTSSEVNVHSLFRKHKKTIELQLYYQWTQTVVPCGFVQFTAPVNAATNVQMLNAMGWLSANSVSGYAYFNPVSQVNIFNYNNNTFALGASSILVNGIYRSV